MRIVKGILALVARQWCEIVGHTDGPPNIDICGRCGTSAWESFWLCPYNRDMTLPRGLWERFSR